VSCPACRLAAVPPDRLYLMGVVTGMVMGEAKHKLGSHEAGLGSARFCEAHKRELDELAVMARKAMGL